jgi:ribosomal protein S12 methylthiotransferase accessory factor
MRFPESTQAFELPAELRAVRNLVSSEGGLIDAVRKVSSEGAEFAVYIATMGELEALHPNIRRTSKKPTGVEMAGGGGSPEPELAKAIATIEAVERYSSSVPNPNIVWASQDDLGIGALDVESMPQCSAEELAHPKCLARKYDSSERIRWIDAWSFSDERPIAVPAVAVWLHLPAMTSSELFALPISTGCAAHTNLSKAVVNGICEVVERDSISLTWLQMLSLPPIEFDEGPPELFDALESAKLSGRAHFFFDATTDVGVPTIYCVDEDLSSATMRHVVMCATDLDPARAVIKIVREIASSRIGLEQGQEVPTDVNDFHGVFHGAQYMGRPEMAGAFDFLLASSTPRRQFSSISSFIGTPEDELSLLLDVLTATNCTVLAVDISTRESMAVGIKAVRVLIPELMPLSFAYRTRFLGHPRLYSAPHAMGLRSLPESEINPNPQPFA